MSCEITNTQTKELKPFYTINGKTFNNLKDALKATEDGQALSVGFANTEDVKTALTEEDFMNSENDFTIFEGKVKVKEGVLNEVGQIPISFNPTTQIGISNQLIRDGLVNEIVEKQGDNIILSSEGVTSLKQKLNSQDILIELQSNSATHGYTKKGDSFVITPTFGKVEVSGRFMTEEEIQKAVEEDNLSFTQEPELLIYRQARLKQLEGSSLSYKPTTDSNDSLVSSLTNFLSQIGVSLESIESYKQKYEIKNGVEPDAKALVDIANKVIAFKDGNITLEELSEETSHLIVEGWNQTEIENLLRTIHQTQEWTQHADAYRELYSKHYPADQVENIVRREVLGKFLANRLKNPNTPSTEVEVSIFNYVMNLLRSFFNKVSQLTSREQTQQLENFSQRVNTLLHNKQLENYINQQNLTNSIFSPMYSISESSPFYKIHEQVGIALDKVEKELQILQDLSRSSSPLIPDKLEKELRNREAIETAKTESEEADRVAFSITGIFGIFDTKVRELETIIKNTPEEDGMGIQEVQVYTFLKNEMLPNLQVIASSLNKKGGVANREAILKYVNESFERYQRVAGEVEGRPIKDANKMILEEIEHRTGVEDRKKMENFMDQEQRDHTVFFKMLGQNVLSKIPQLQRLGRLIHDMSRLVRSNFITTADPFYKKLTKVAQKLPRLAKEGFYWSHRDRADIQKRRTEARAKALISVLNLEISTEELLKELPELTPKTVEKYITENKLSETPKSKMYEWRYEADYLSAISDVRNRDSKTNQNRLKLMELYRKVGISADTYQIISEHKRAVGKINAQMGENADPNDPINLTLEKELSRIKASRASHKSLFDQTKSLKEGLKVLDPKAYSPLNPNQLKIGRNDYISIDRNNASLEAIIAFDLSKVDRDALERKEQAEAILEEDSNADTSITGWTKDSKGTWTDNQTLYEKGDTKSLKEDLRDIWNSEYEKALATGASPAASRVLANKRTYRWMQRMASISFSQDYWDALLTNQSIETLVEANRAQLSGAMGKLEMNKTSKQNIANILRRYQEAYDYREISVEDMSVLDREAIIRSEGIIKSNNKIIIEELNSIGVDVNLATSELSERRPNNSFYAIFKDQYGKEYADATTNEKIEYLEAQASPGTSDSFRKFRQAVEKHAEKKKLLKGAWLDVVTNMGYTEVTPANQDQILIAYLERRLPAYFQRFSPEGYSEILSELENNMEQVLKGENTLLDDLINNKRPNFELRVSKVTQEQRGVKYAQSVDVYKRKFEEAQEETDRGQRLIKSYESFLHIAGEDDSNFDSSTLDQSFLDNFGISVDGKGTLSAPTRNLDEFESLVNLLTMRALALEKYNNLLKVSVFQFAKMPKTNLDRIKNNPVGGIKYMIEDLIRYREDEEDAFARSEARRIPRIGFSNMPLEDVSTDLFAVAFLDLYNAELFKQRTEALSSALAMQEALSKIKVKGKHTKESNIWEMSNNTIDNFFFGRQTSWNAEIDIMGQKIDVSKVMQVFRNFVQINALGFSLPVALTSMTTAFSNKATQRFVNYHLYDKASNRANLEFTKLMAGSAQDVGQLYAQSKLERLMQLFGNYDLTERLSNAAFGYGWRNTTSPNKLAFAVHQLGNFPVIPRVVLSKLMEYRIIDGKFQSWSNFKTLEKTKNPKITNTELREKFDSFENNALYDYIEVDKGQIFNSQKLFEDGILKNNDGTLMSLEQVEEQLQKTYLNVTNDISYNVSQYDGIIDASQKVEAQRHPLLSFATMFKGWLSIASSRNFAPEFYNQQTGNWEQGVLTTISSSLNNILKTSKKEKRNPLEVAREVFNEMTPAQKANLKSLGFSTAVVGVFTLMTALLVGMADDDEEDNYLLQLAAYISMRTLNESFSASLGVPSEIYSTISSPISSTATIKAAFDILNVANVNEQVSRGMYEEKNKYLVNLFKMTFMKNFYGISDAEHIKDAREGYSYFNQKGSLYSVLSIVKYLNDKDNE